MLERWENIQRERGNSAAAEMAKVLRMEFGDVPLQEKPLAIVSPEVVKNVVSNYFEITTEELIAFNTKRRFTYPRQLAMYALRDMGDYTLVSIGESFNNRDYSTVGHALTRAERLLSIDPKVVRDYHSIKLGINLVLSGEPVDSDNRKSATEANIAEVNSPVGQFTIDQLLSVVSAHFQVEEAVLKGRDRHKNVAIARHISALLLRRFTQLGLEDIGKVLGNRDHSTIKWSLAQIKKICARNELVRADIEKIMEDLKALDLNSGK